MADVVVAIPAYGGTVHIGTMRSLIADVMAFAQAGKTVSIFDQAHGAEIDTVRAQIVAEFLAESDAHHLIMVDSDVVWSRGGLLKLVNAGVDFVAGAYPHRKDPITWPVQMLDGAGKQGDLCEVKAVPAGFLCVTRKALNQMCQTYDDLRFESSKTSAPIWALFDHVTIGRTRLSEDLSFCHRWRAMGGKIYVDPTIKMGHIGPKVFTGEFNEV